MNFQVPQFIEVEDTIFGPLTFKQFLYLAGGGGMIFLIYVFLPWYLGVIPMAIIAFGAVLLAFYKPNNRPFVAALESAFRYQIKNKLYIWKKGPTDGRGSPPPAGGAGQASNLPKLSQSKLKDLTWSLDIREGTH